MENNNILLYLTLIMFAISFSILVLGIVAFAMRIATVRRIMRKTNWLLKGAPLIRVIEGGKNHESAKKGKI